MPPPPDAAKHWFLEDGELATWIDAPWRDIDLLTFITDWPVDLDHGTHFVIFYSRTCEHCRTFFHDEVAVDPDLAARVVGVEVPASATSLRGDDDQVCRCRTA